MEHYLIGLAAIIVLGIAAQWLGWRLKLPSILLLLVFGILAGPIFDILDPDELFGGLLFPLVSASVAIILFEGGLSLKFKELKGTGKIVRNLTSIGVIVTWILSSAGAHYIVGLDFYLSILMGAILVVTGPTVIIPLLRQIRPIGRAGSIVKWEGIVNDPIGAILAVLVFEAILAGGIGTEIGEIIWGVIRAIVFGGAFGVFGALVIIGLLRYYLVPDFLQNPVSLMVLIGSYTLADHFQAESGLLAVTVMGIILTNQKRVSIQHILEFKENLRVILISSLFIILAARLPLGQLAFTSISGWIFVAVLILFVRPLSVFASSIGSAITFKDKLFISWMAPRGIVAAAVISVFAIRLNEINYPGTEMLVPLMFQIIIGTVAIYGLTAPIVARKLKVSQPDPQGVLFAGAHSWAREIAKALLDNGFKVILIDTNWRNVADARSAGLEAHFGNILSENFLSDLSLDGIGYLMALTTNDEVNTLAVMHFEGIFGRENVFQLPLMIQDGSRRRQDLPLHMQGRFLFNKEMTFHGLNERFKSGSAIKMTPLTEEFDYDKYIAKHGQDTVRLFTITRDNKLRIRTIDSDSTPSKGETIVALVKEDSLS